MENNIKNHSQIMEVKGSQVIGILLGHICGVLLSAGLIMWGWNTIAPHFNAPMFTYWEVLIVRLALKSITNIFRKKG